MKNHYKTLNLQDCASMVDIKHAYRSLALAHHPDRGGDQEVMKEINVAYEFLVKHKEEYDAHLKPVLQGRQFGFTIIVGGFRSTTGATSASWTF